MEALSPTVWFPVVTLVIGISLKAIFDALTENRKVALERESRVERRKEIILLQRIDLQRKALGDLQIALSDLMRSVSVQQQYLRKKYRETGFWGESDAPPSVDETARTNFRAVTLMKVRVGNDEIRELAEKLSSSCSTITLVDSDEVGQALYNTSALMYSEINEKIGCALRALEHDEQALLI